MFKVYYEWDTYNNKYRVWEDRNPGDTFDLIAKECFLDMLDKYNKLGIEPEEGMPEG